MVDFLGSSLCCVWFRLRTNCEVLFRGMAGCWEEEENEVLGNENSLDSLEAERSRNCWAGQWV